MEDAKTYGRKVVRPAQKNSKKKDYTKRLMIVMIMCVLVGAIISGIITGLVVHRADVKKYTTKTISIEEAETIRSASPYGMDGRVFREEVSMNWSSGEAMGFVPLDCDMDENLQEFTYCLCYGYNIDFCLVMGLIQKESDFRSDIISETNDYGLMQINQSNHEWLTETIGVTDFLDPQQNIRAGIFVLRGLFEKYGDTHKALMAYNMGEGNAQRLWSHGIVQSSYSDKVMEYAAQFQEQIDSKKGE